MAKRRAIPGAASPRQAEGPPRPHGVVQALAGTPAQRSYVHAAKTKGYRSRAAFKIVS